MELSNVRSVFHMEIPEGTDYQATFTYEDDLGFPIDLTGYTVDLKVRAFMEGFSGYDIPLPKLALSTTIDINGSGVILWGTAGTITVQISNVSTQQLDWSRAVYDINLIDPTGKVVPFISGYMLIVARSSKQPFTRQPIANTDLSGIPVSDSVTPELVPGIWYGSSIYGYPGEFYY